MAKSPKLHTTQQHIRSIVNDRQLITFIKIEPQNYLDTSRLKHLPLLYWTMQKHILEAKSVNLQAPEEGGEANRRQNKAPTEKKPNLKLIK